MSVIFVPFVDTCCGCPRLGEGWGKCARFALSRRPKKGDTPPYRRSKRTARQQRGLAAIKLGKPIAHNAGEKEVGFGRCVLPEGALAPHTGLVKKARRLHAS